MSKQLKWKALEDWFEQLKKNAKYGKPKKQVIVDDEIEFNYKPKKRR